jgi:hypothetical protein
MEFEEGLWEQCSDLSRLNWRPRKILFSPKWEVVLESGKKESKDVYIYKKVCFGKPDLIEQSNEVGIQMYIKVHGRVRSYPK